MDGGSRSKVTPFRHGKFRRYDYIGASLRRIMDGQTPQTIDLTKLTDLMESIEADFDYMDEAVKTENKQGLEYVKWLLTELGVEA